MRRLREAIRQKLTELWKNLSWILHHDNDSEDCSKIAKFWANTTSHGYRSGDVDDVQRRSRFAHKGHSWWRIMGVWLLHWKKSPVIPMEASRRAKKPKPKKARQVRSNVKVLLTVFFDCNGVVHHECLPQGRTVNKEFYLKVINRLRKAIRQKLTELWKKTNQGFCSMITHQFTHQCLCLSFWPKTKP